MIRFPTKGERQIVCAMRDLTINGNPAKVSGWNNQYAKVTDITTGLSAEWSWQTAVTIASTHKRFQS